MGIAERAHLPRIGVPVDPIGRNGIDRGERDLVATHSTEQLELTLENGADNLRFRHLSGPLRVIIGLPTDEKVFDIHEDAVGSFVVRNPQNGNTPHVISDEPFYLKDDFHVYGMARMFYDELVLISTSTTGIRVQVHPGDISRFPRGGIGPQPQMRQIE